MSEITIPTESQRRLLHLSRRTLENFVRGAGRTTEADEVLEDPYLQLTDYGAFVSLHIDRELRGCIGNCNGDTPLFKTVIEMTEAAASRDHRMEPVSMDELDAIRIDISVLSPLQRVENPQLLEVNKHGLHVASGHRRGVLLPQVATEYGWDIQTFLEQTCRKAGLKKNAWKNPATVVSSFTALVIEERK
ncbi:MAG: AmmeMemoRadiSam system protein A [Deltaproteobacteria bacterium]|nr:AmmeMemoRadiSam system protein A [Deltaproteobacteria bacterium]